MTAIMGSISSAAMSFVSQLVIEGQSRILLVVVDGLGGAADSGKTELEVAALPNLDRLAARSSLGLVIPVETGITPGSGPAHLALFGYDPVEHQVGRGVLEAMGVGLEVRPTDLCCRANFAIIDAEGRIVDRRAGRLPTEESAELCRLLQERLDKVGDVEVIIRPGIEHRFVVLFRGEGLEDGLTESDPQHEGLAPLEVESTRPQAEKAARVVNDFLARAGEVLSGDKRANWVLLRGLARPPSIQAFPERYRLKAACVAAYPMYRGLGRLVGMDVLDAGDSWDGEMAAVKRSKQAYDFFYLHFKEADKAGEDGDFDAKVEVLERFDEEIVPQVIRNGFDVVCITGDHSTPALLRAHSWHPVPVLVWSRFTRPHLGSSFTEQSCASGSLGTFHSRHLMTLLLAHGQRLRKFGA